MMGWMYALPARMSGVGTKRTCRGDRWMSVLGGKADLIRSSADVDLFTLSALSRCDRQAVRVDQQQDCEGARAHDPPIATVL
jgi:hypothetical protein